MLVELALQSDIPIYMQIRTQIIEDIATGEFKPGEALPSVRKFAEDLGINLHTVNKAYTLLKQDEFIQVHRQKGVVVHPDGPPKANTTYLTQLSTELRPMIVEAICRGVDEEGFF
jgi:DNA-binding transcriptional regulator YhcF (GntR family)